MKPRTYKIAVLLIVNVMACAAGYAHDAISKVPKTAVSVQAQDVAMIAKAFMTSPTNASSPTYAYAISHDAYSYASSTLSDSDLRKEIRNGNVTEKTKTYTNSVPVTDDDKLKIHNQFGPVIINTWDKNEFKVDVEIKVDANNDAEAQKLLDAVSINFNPKNKAGNIAFHTNIHSTGGNWVSGFWIFTKVHKTSVTYNVYMPAKNSLTIDNSFGNIILPSLEGQLKISNSFGKLVAKSITNSGNVIDVKYGNVNIEDLAASQLNISFGSLNVRSVDNVNANIRHGSAKIGRLVNSGIIHTQFGAVEIGDVDKDLKLLKINSGFAPVKIKLSPDMNADFDVTTKFGDFNYNNDVTVTSKTPEKQRGSTGKNYKGHIGKGDTDKIIIINTNFGGVKFE